HGGNASDFFVNSPRKLDTSARIANRLGNLVRRVTNEGGLAKEQSLLSLQLERLEEQRSGFAALAEKGRVEMSIENLAGRLAMLDARSALREAAFPNRTGAVLSLWRRGVYKHTGGVAGA